MPQTVEALYHDGVVELKRKPTGMRNAKTLVIFLDPEEAPEHHVVDLGMVKKGKSSVDKWIGIIEDAVQYVICERNDCDVLATRNKADFGDRPNVLDPAELIERIRTAGA